MSTRAAIYVRVSTDDQRDNGYSIDSQLRMIKEYCEKNSYNIIDVYNNAGHSGKDLMRPEMQRLLKNIKFTDEFITKSSKDYLRYLNKIIVNNNIGIKYKEIIDKDKLKDIEQDYDILSITKIKNNKYSNEYLTNFITKSKEHLYVDGIISCPYVEENNKKTNNYIIENVIKALDENIEYLIRVKNKFHYLGYFQDEELIKTKIESLKKLNNSIKK